jgi:hypothetical protein
LRIVKCQAPVNSAKSVAEILRVNAKTLKRIDISENYFNENTKYILQALKEYKDLEYANFDRIDLN